MADGRPGAPKKYQEGYLRLDANLPASMVVRFEEFCEKFNISKTDAITIALNFCFMSAAEREQKLEAAVFQLEIANRDRARLAEELSRKTARLDALLASHSQADEFKVRNPEADNFILSRLKLIEEGRLTKSSRDFSISHLRGFLKDRNLPNEQKMEILEAIKRLLEVELKDEEKELISRAESQGKKLKDCIKPAEVRYDFTQKEEPEVRDDVFDELREEAERMEEAGKA